MTPLSVKKKLDFYRTVKRSGKKILQKRLAEDLVEVWVVPKNAERRKIIPYVFVFTFEKGDVDIICLLRQRKTSRILEFLELFHHDSDEYRIY